MHSILPSVYSNTCERIKTTRCRFMAALVFNSLSYAWDAIKIPVMFIHGNVFASYVVRGWWLTELQENERGTEKVSKGLRMLY